MKYKQKTMEFATKLYKKTLKYEFFIAQNEKNQQ